MKFLIINADYSKFLPWFYTQHPRLEQKPYEEQVQAQVKSLYKVTDKK